MKALRKMAKSNLIRRAFSLAIFKMAACQEKIPIAILGSGEDPGDEVGQNIVEHLQSSNSVVLNLNYFISNCFFYRQQIYFKGMSYEQNISIKQIDLVAKMSKHSP